MKKQFKVIGIYPNSHFKIGDTLEESEQLPHGCVGKFIDEVTGWAWVKNAEIYTLLFKEIQVITLPDHYEGELNRKRIKAYKALHEQYNLEESTVRNIFCKGADWYKEEASKS